MADDGEVAGDVEVKDGERRSADEPGKGRLRRRASTIAGRAVSGGLFFFVVGLALFALLLFRSFENNSLVFLAAIVSVALIFYGSGSQAALTFEGRQTDTARLNLWVGGGAAVLALIFGQFIIWNEIPIRSVFRVNAVPIIVDVEYCLVSDLECLGDGTASSRSAAATGSGPARAFSGTEIADRDRQEFEAVARAVSVWGDRDRSFIQDVSTGDRIRRRYLVFTDRRVEFRLEQEVSNHFRIGRQIAFDLPKGAPAPALFGDPSRIASAPKSNLAPGCLRKALPNGPLCALYYDKTDPNHLVEGSYSVRVAVLPKSFVSAGDGTFTATPPAQDGSAAPPRSIDYVVE